MNLAGKTILVTGATGFIGSRLVEVLHKQHGCQVRGLVHNFSKASRLSRLPIKMVGGDISNRASLTNAVQGCDIVIHTAMGTAPGAYRRDTVTGTENVLEAARAAGVKRVVHFSTISVYGLTRDGNLSETSRRGPLLDDYSRNKSDAERVALDIHRSSGLPISILQPTVVYGPFAGWTYGPINELQRNRVVVPNGGDGFCNAVYIDDVVDAAILAAWHPSAVGETFLISGAEPVTWKEFYGAYESMLGFSSTVGMTYKEFKRESRRLASWRDLKNDLITLARHPSGIRLSRSSLLFRIPKSIVRSLAPRSWRWSPKSQIPQYPPRPPAKPEKPLLFDESRFRWQATRTRVCIDKARNVLGYDPKYNFESGMTNTRRWAEWAAVLQEQGA
jgi:nucleoside-diphosphate-sugar epimerase